MKYPKFYSNYNVASKLHKYIKIIDKDYFILVVNQTTKTNKLGTHLISLFKSSHLPDIDQWCQIGHLTFHTAFVLATRQIKKAEK